MPKVNVDYGDKIVHFVAYAILCLLWFFTGVFQFKMTKKRTLYLASILSISFGIIIEVLQSVFTNYRTLGFYDMIANTTGVFLMILVLSFYKSIDIKKI